MDSARFDGLRDKASMMFQHCFPAVETKERISAKSIAPCNDPAAKTGLVPGHVTRELHWLQSPV
jgi:hypothetical protein